MRSGEVIQERVEDNTINIIAVQMRSINRRGNTDAGATSGKFVTHDILQVRMVIYRQVGSFYPVAIKSIAWSAGTPVIGGSQFLNDIAFKQVHKRIVAMQGNVGRNIRTAVVPKWVAAVVVCKYIGIGTLLDHHSMTQGFENIVLNQAMCSMGCQGDTIAVATTAVIVGMVKIAVPNFEMQALVDPDVAFVSECTFDIADPAVGGILKFYSDGISLVDAFDPDIFNPHFFF